MSDIPKKAILIDSNNRSFREVEVNNYEDINKHIGCDCFTVAMDIDNDTIYVDDEGLLKPIENAFSVEGGHQEFVGNGLIIGLDSSSGESTDVNITITELKQKIKFLSGLELAMKYR